MFNIKERKLNKKIFNRMFAHPILKMGQVKHSCLLGCGLRPISCKVGPFESIGGVSRSDVVMNPFIFLLACYRPKHSFYINLESDYSN